MQNKTYVIGHVNPDTDSIASAMGYAWLLRQRDGVDTVAARAGAINPQSAWVLKQLALEAPVSFWIPHLARRECRREVGDKVNHPELAMLWMR